MWVLEFALAILLLLGGVVVAASVRRARSDIDHVAESTGRLHSIAAENARMAKAAQDVARAVDTTTAAVDLGTNIVRASHQAIAAIPFGVLESIPATRRTSRIVRGIHDGTSAGVYKAIIGANKVIGDAVRDAINPPAGAPAAPAPKQVQVERIDAVPLEVTPALEAADTVVDPEVTVEREG